MPSRGLIMLSVGIFSTIGGYLPTLVGQGTFSAASIIGAAVGGFLGIYVAYKLSEV